MGHGCHLSSRGTGTTQEGAERLRELEAGEGPSKAASSGVGRTAVLMNSKQLQLMAQDEVSQWSSMEGVHESPPITEELLKIGGFPGWKNQLSVRV